MVHVAMHNLFYGLATCRRIHIKRRWQCRHSLYYLKNSSVAYFSCNEQWPVNNRMSQMFSYYMYFRLIISDSVFACVCHLIVGVPVCLYSN